jgi:hypothetical protein
LSPSVRSDACRCFVCLSDPMSDQTLSVCPIRCLIRLCLYVRSDVCRCFDCLSDPMSVGALSLHATCMYALFAFCAFGFIFRNRGPSQKKCRDAHTHARPRLPPGAACACVCSVRVCVYVSHVNVYMGACMYVLTPTPTRTHTVLKCVRMHACISYP